MDEAKKVAEAVAARAIQQDNLSALLQVAALLRKGPGKRETGCSRSFEKVTQPDQGWMT